MANKKRLICANTLREELSTLTMTITGLRAGKGVLKEFMEQYRESVLRIVDEQATVDAVEVVRCKKCRFYGRYVASDFCEWNEIGMKPDDFCSYGEKKDMEG